MKKKYLNLITALFLGTIANAQIVDNVIDDPGDIAIVAYHDNDDGFSFVLLDNCPDGTSIRFIDEEWNGSSFNSTTSEGEVLWTNTSGGMINQGTVIHITDADDNGVGITASEGTTAIEILNFNIISGDEIIAITGTRTSPGTFLTFYGDNSTDLSGTSLINGQTAIQNAAVGFGYYSGSTDCSGISLQDCTERFHNISNWTFSPAYSFPSLAISFLDTSVLSVNTVQEENFQLYPNPVKDKLVVKGDKNIEKIVLSNSLGQIIKEEKVSRTSVEINLSRIRPGVYFAKVFFENKVQIIRFIKE